MLTAIFENYNYAIVIILMMIGLYVVFSSRNLIKKLVGFWVGHQCRKQPYPGENLWPQPLGVLPI